MDNLKQLEKDYKTVTTSEHRFFDLHLRETFEYRDLIWLFVKRDFVSQYKQTILGPVWALIQPLLTTLIYAFVFGRLANLPVQDSPDSPLVPGILFYLAGNVCWSFFASNVSAVSGTFINNVAVMGKVYYPRLVQPIATTFSRLLSFSIQLVMLVGFSIFYAVTGKYEFIITSKLLLLPVSIIEMMILSAGVGIIISSVTTKYRDLQMIVGFGLQLWQYASPIAYGLLLISEQIPDAMNIYMLNPFTPVITTIRYSLFGGGYFNLPYYIVSWIISLLLFFIGLIIFSRIERNFADTV